MAARLIKAAQNIIAAIVRLFRWWFGLIGRQDTMRAKAVVACVGLLVLCFVCSVPVALVNGPSKPKPAVANAPTVQQVAAASTPTAKPASPTPEPTNTPKPTSTPKPSPTLAPTVEPTNTPKPTAKPKPTAAPKPAPKPLAVTSRWNTNGADRYNCGDFGTYDEAYAVYKANLPGDPNRLDKDDDGIPCENLPGAP